MQHDPVLLASVVVLAVAFCFLLADYRAYKRNQEAAKDARRDKNCRHCFARLPVSKVVKPGFFKCEAVQVVRCPYCGTSNKVI